MAIRKQLMLVAAMLSLLAGDAPAAAFPKPDADRVAIYRVVAQKASVLFKTRDRPLIEVHSETVDPTTIFSNRRPTFTHADADTVDSFFAEMPRLKDLAKSIRGLRGIVIGRTGGTRFTDQDDRISETISFSGVGLNATRTQGLVWIRHSGGEDFFVVEKDKGLWAVTGRDGPLVMY